MTVSAAEHRLPIARLLYGRIGMLSRMALKAAISSGKCQVNGTVIGPAYRVAAGDQVAVELPASPSSMTPEALPLTVVWEDEHLAVVDKPAGMLIHPTLGVKTGTLANAMSHRFNPGASPPVVRPGFPHRLDKDTSGLVIVARSPLALRRLALAFANRQIGKSYRAQTMGWLPEAEGLLATPIGRRHKGPPFWVALPEGKPAETRFTVVRRLPDGCVLDLQPITGRTNQIRAHCAHAGWPIRGDGWYGGAPFPRLCLHACRLAFPHPVSGRWIEVNSEPDWDRALL